MKFRAVVINARIIRRTAAGLLTAVIAVGAAAAVKNSARTAEVFGAIDSEELMRQELYDEQSEETEHGIDSARLLEEYSPIFKEPEKAPEIVPIEEPTELPTEPPQIPIEEPITPAPVSEEKVSGGMKLTNNTDFRVNLEELADNPPSFEKTEGEPLVLIMHTHTTESYNDVSDNDSGRSTDSARNMIAVGEIIKNALAEEGITAVHDTTVHDYPQYNGSYTRALATIRADLQKYPSVQIVLDVHRDAVIKSDGTKVKMTAEVNGEAAAEVMLVVGTNAMGLEHSGWRKNLAFAAAIQRTAEEMYPGLMRPINLRKERFNQHMTSGSLILEVGTSGNDMAEAKSAAWAAAKAIAEVIG